MVITEGRKEAEGTGYPNEILEGLSIMREGKWKKTQVLSKYHGGRKYEWKVVDWDGYWQHKEMKKGISESYNGWGWKQFLKIL